MKDNEIPKFIYLDQNKWVEIEKVEFGEKKNETISKILTMLRDLVNSDKLIIPIDFNRLTETSHRSLSHTRERLSELMIEMSKGYAVLPFLYAEEFEIRNLISRKNGLNEVNLKELLINQNTENLLAGTPQIVGEIPSKDLELINSRIRQLISTNEFKQYILSTPAQRDIDFEQEHIKRAEQAREILRTMQNDTERKKYLITGDYQRLMRKIMDTFKVTDNFEGQISPLEKVGNLLMIRNALPIPIRSIQDQVAFMRECPLYYTHRTLVSYRDRDIRRPIESNDNIDIVQFVTPLVYFHYIVGEKYFMTLANQAKLDELYNTVLCKELVELKPHLEFLLNNN